MAVKFTNNKQNSYTKIKIVSKDNSNISIIAPITNSTMIVSNSNKTLNFELQPVNNKYIGVREDNKLLNNRTFTTKKLGDNLYTNSSLLSGGATPFTIEFYSLIKGSSKNASGYPEFTYPLISKNNNSGGGEQTFSITNTMNPIIFRNSYFAPFENAFGKCKIKINEKNKHTITYDGAALRWFVDDKQEVITGTLNGFRTDANTPFTFFRHSIPSYSAHDTNTHGLIDNINIFDGECRKVREYDEHADKLIVDLAFDGENNSTKIVDNGTIGLTWNVHGNAKISTDQRFDGFSSLYLDGSSTLKLNNNIFNFDKSDFTINFDMLPIDNSQYNIIISSDQPVVNGNLTFIALGSNTDNVGRANKLYIFEYLYNNGNNCTLKTLRDITFNIITNIKIIKKNSVLYIFINNILDSQVPHDREFNLTYNISTILGGSIFDSGNKFKGYIKNFKVYKDVAIIPEDPTGKIQLDFDNNLVDKYGNSTWTDNGVTFNQVNSVKGSSIYTSGTQNIVCGANNNFNYGNSDFLIETDVKQMNKGSQFSAVLSNNNNYGTPVLTFGGTQSKFALYKDSGSSATHNIGNWEASDYTVINNVYYNIKFMRKGSNLIFKKNDIVVGISNVALSGLINFNMNNYTAIGPAGSYNNAFNGYIDNFKSIKNYTDEVIIDKPAIHLPLETNAINTGFTPLTINSVGSPIYTTIDGKKCIKFEKSKYLSINSNNIFNLGTNSDFYIEFYIYPLLSTTVSDSIQTILSNNNTWSSTFQSTQRFSMYINQSTNSIKFDLGARFWTDWLNIISLNEWNKITLSKEQNKVIFCGYEFYVNADFNLSISNLFIGVSGWDTSRYFTDGYMSNFKMFVGTSEIPETYNDKAVLDLDFAPPLDKDGNRTSYLFKDNNNKCVIHPVNIEYRDYLDSQYCCTLNGTNQYLQLGKNDLLNFGLDDFIIYIKFRFINDSTWNVLLANGETSTNSSYSFIGVGSNNILTFRINNFDYMTANEAIVGTINTLIIRSVNSTVQMVLNKEITDFVTVSSINLNSNSNTIIGGTNISGNTDFRLNGTIYDLKVFRNTSDLSVLGNLVSELPEFPQPDPYWDNVVAYLPLINNYFDVKRNTWSVVGTPDITNHDNPISNNGSIRFHQWSNLRTTLPPVGTQDFTIEFWVKPMSAGDTYGRLFELGPRSATNLVFNNTVQNWPPQIMSQINNYYTNVFENINLSANTWSFIVYQRVGYNYQLFINGIKVVDNYITAAYNLSGTSTFNLNSNQNNGERFDAYYTMLRVTHGVARYNDNFIPPTKVFPTY